MTSSDTTPRDKKPLAIDAVELTKIYGSGNTEVVAMRDATMQVAQGEVVALLGPSGSGKSTFLTAVGLINPPTSGHITIKDQLVLDGATAHANRRSFRRKHIGFIFQKSNLIPFLSAAENVQIAMQLNGETRGFARRRAIGFALRSSAICARRRIRFVPFRPSAGCRSGRASRCSRSATR